MNSLLRTFFTCMFFWMPALWLTAQETGLETMKDTAAFKQQLKKITSTTSTIQSEFEQEKNISVLDEKIITSGKFAFKSPTSLRWEYLVPFEYLIVLNQKNVTIKDGEKVNRYDMEANRVFREINDLMIEIVQGDVVNHEKYHIKYFENSQLFSLQLSPRMKTMKQFLQTIEIGFDRKDLSVTSVKMVEKSGDYTSIVFREKKLNAPLADQVFMVD